MEITQSMMDYANFMEKYVEPAMAFIYYFVISIVGLINFVSDIVGLAGFG